MSLLAPYEPTPDNPWDAAAAAHLLRRAGFCPSAEELQQTLDAGPGATVRRLVRPTDPETPAHEELDPLGPAIAVRDDIEALRGWWLLRMARTNRPLAARLAVFWHGHFATSNTKVRSAPLMLQQLRTIERHALGSFRDLTIAIARDPAMIVWLDGRQNVKGRPNENFARELFELFTLGVGHYSERDIKEAARAFTGWGVERGRFRFAPLDHDGGEKEVLGVPGLLDGADVVDAALAQPAAARFIAAKLLREFVTPQPPDELIDALAASLRAKSFDIAPVLEELFASRAFFDPQWRSTRIKSPVEYVVGLVRSLELQGVSGRSDSTLQMGQALFEPPSVAGWPGHRTWLDSATMLVRLNVAQLAIRDYLKPADLCKTYEVSDPAAARDLAVRLTLPAGVPDTVARTLEILSGSTDETLRNALDALTACPEYQMA